MKAHLAPHLVFGAALVVLTLVQPVQAADQESAADKQRKLIAILKSDAPPQDKAIPCKQLAIYGNKEAVPVLAPLLENKDLASWARIALEVIPGPEADEALRSALPKLSGTLLIGTINSIGVRRDAKAVQPLAGKLTDPDVEVVAAAACALGKISGKDAAKALHQALSSGNKQTLPAIAEGTILCAEGFLNESKFAEATPLYDAVRAAPVPKQRWLEATRGAILSRQTAGLPLLIEELRSQERAQFAMALRTARELKGREVTEAIGAELERSGSDHAVMLVLVLADRADAAVLPKLLQVAEKGNKASRIATLEVLDRFNDSSAVPVLLSAATDADAEVAKPAKSTLTRMEGKAVDTALLSQLPQAKGKARQTIIELAALRRIEGAVPAVMTSVEDSDAELRRAALTTLGVIGSEQQLTKLVGLLAKAEGEDREAVEGALNSICARNGAKCLPHVLPLTKNSDSDLRILALHALATIGGRDALTAVNSAVNDEDESVRDEAVGTLATWPNNWPDDAAVAEPLMALVKSSQKRAYQVQGARGYLLYLQENKKMTNADKVKAVEELLPLLKQPAEKRLAISALGAIPSAKSLDSLKALAGEPAIAEEAYLALVTVATAKDLEGGSKEARRQALQTALDNAKNDATLKKARDALKAVQ